MSWKERATPVSGWKARATPVGESVDSGDVGSPLEAALKAQTGDVVTVDTPTGPAQFTRKGERVMSAEEREPMFGAMEAGARQRGLEGALSFLSGGGPLIDEGKGLEAALNINDPRSMKEKYLWAQDVAKRDIASATAHASPMVTVRGVTVPVLPALGAALPQLLAPNPSTWAARIALGTEQGVQQMAGASDASLVRGELPAYLRDVGTAGAAGGLTISFGVQKLIQGGASRVGDVVAGRQASELAALRQAAGADPLSDALAATGKRGAGLPGSPGYSVTDASRFVEPLAEAEAGGMRMGNIGRRSGVGGVRSAPRTQGPELGLPGEPGFEVIEGSRFAPSAGEALMSEVEGLSLAREQAMRDAASRATANYFRPSAMTQEVLPRVGQQAGNVAVGAGLGVPASFAMMAGGMSPASAVAAGMGSTASLAASRGAAASARELAATPLVQVDALTRFIQGSQATQQAMQSSARAAPQVGRESRDAIDAFLRGG
jgi:hypothetical protein